MARGETINDYYGGKNIQNDLVTNKRLTDRKKNKIKKKKNFYDIVTGTVVVIF